MARTLPQPQHDERAIDGNLAVLAPNDRPLRLNEAGLALIRQRLEDADRDNPAFAAQRDRLLGAVTAALDGLLLHVAPEIERVLARGVWALEGIDLRTLADAEDIEIEIVHRADRLDFDFGQRVARRVWSTIGRTYDTEFLLQFTLLPLPLWHRAQAWVRAHGRDEDTLGVPLLVRE